jgi:hypothetical protein
VTASSSPAVSRTERVITPSENKPMGGSALGPDATRPRLGFSPTRPQCADGIRMDPAMSLAWAAGTMPAATAAADPPELPPGERSSAHGLWVTPAATGSVVPISASSGMFVRPRFTRPAARNAAASALSASALQPRSRRKAIPSWYGSPATSAL